MPTLQDYQPSQKHLRLWLTTRKAPAADALPGFFGTDGADGWWFALAIGAELWGLGNLWSATRFPPAFVVLLFILDMVGALLAHACAKQECEQRNLREIYMPLPGGREEIRIRQHVKIGNKIARVIGWLFILGVAIFKVLAVMHFSDSLAGPVYLSVIVAYIVAAGVHLFCTGYVLCDLWRKGMWWLEKHSYSAALSANNPTAAGWPQRYNHRFTSAQELETGSFGKEDRHKLSKVGPASNGKGNVFLLETYSLLDDEDVKELIAIQGGGDGAIERHRAIMRQCLIMQFAMFLGINLQGLVGLAPNPPDAAAALKQQDEPTRIQ